MQAPSEAIFLAQIVLLLLVGRLMGEAVRKQTLASLLRGSLPGVSMPISCIPATSCSSMPARWVWRASSQSGWVRTTGPFFGIPLFPPEWGQFAAIQAVAPSLRMEVIPISLRDAGEIERAVTAFVLLE